MSKSKNLPRRAPRKQGITGPLMFDARGKLIPRDDSPVELWLCVHRESDTGKAWLVSIDGRYQSGVWVPKALIDIGEACGGLQAWHHSYLKRDPVHMCMMPAFLAMEKGLVPKPGARAA